MGWHGGGPKKGSHPRRVFIGDGVIYRVKEKSRIGGNRLVDGWGVFITGTGRGECVFEHKSFQVCLDWAKDRQREYLNKPSHLSLQYGDDRELRDDGRRAKKRKIVG